MILFPARHRPNLILCQICHDPISSDLELVPWHGDLICTKAKEATKLDDCSMHMIVGPNQQVVELANFITVRTVDVLADQLLGIGCYWECAGGRSNGSRASCGSAVSRCRCADPTTWRRSDGHVRLLCRGHLDVRLPGLDVHLWRRGLHSDLRRRLLDFYVRLLRLHSHVRCLW